jgi:hypothetical protein
MHAEPARPPARYVGSLDGVVLERLEAPRAVKTAPYRVVVGVNTAGIRW